MARMVRRGPDDAGKWSNGRVWFGFRRLSILDLSDASHQPMCTPDGRFVLVFNGELYNFRELRGELEGRGIRFRSSGDGEVVLHSLAEYGLDALNRFNGMFALAFYDTVDGSLLLARDHAGIKPLYVADCSRGVIFASQYDQLLAHPWTLDLDLDRDALAIWLRFGHIPAPGALQRGTEMLEPGAWMRIDAAGRIVRGRWFEFPHTNGTLRGEEADEAVEAAVAAATARQCVADVPVGAFLSGGIDSPLVNLMMVRAGFRHPAYTIQTGDLGTDESATAARFAEEFGLDHCLVHLDESRLGELVNESVDACGEPFGVHSTLPTMMIARAAREHGKVLLSGDGGDELFYGYPRLWGLPGLARAFKQPRWIRSVRWWIRRFTGLGGARWSWRMQSLDDVFITRHTHLQPALEIVPALFPGLNPARSHLLYHIDIQSDDSAITSGRWLEYQDHLGKVLLKVDRATMHESVEVRVPLLDREVIDVATQLDWRHCVNTDGTIGKIPLRRALARGTGIATNEKAGFEIPVDRYFRGPLMASFRDLVGARTELLGMPFNGDAANRLMDTHLAGTNVGTGLWMLYSLCLWFDRVFEPARAEARSL